MTAASGRILLVKEFKKGIMEAVGRDFSSTDFDCRCSRPECTVTLIDLDLVAGLDEVADIFAKVTINSGYRCAAHNKEVHGVPDSQHCLGKAADVSSLFASPHDISLAADRIKCFAEGGVGLYSKFCHLDNRGKRARWSGPKQC
jgi:uncharacterized protein YcbK (DUF882 family)